MTRPTRVYLLLFIGLVFCLAPSSVFPQSGSIGVFADPNASDCNVADSGGLVQVYIWHMHTSGSRGVRFRLNVDSVGWTHLGDLHDFESTEGTSVDGVTVCWDQCLSGSFQLMTINFFGSAAPACSIVEVDVYPGAGVEALDCEGNVTNPAAGRVYVNPDGTCTCTACRTGTETACANKVGTSENSASNFCATVPVEQSTWGMIKSFYD